LRDCIKQLRDSRRLPDGNRERSAAGPPDRSRDAVS
jgi:hypothetical protein